MLATIHRVPGLRLALLALAAALVALLPSPSRADALDGELAVQSAYVSVDKGVFLLHARIRYPESEGIRAALLDGVTLIFEVDTRIDRLRRYWFDAEVVALTLRRELSYHTVSDRFVVRDPRNSDQASFPTLEAALEYLGRVDGWPVLVEPQLSAEDRYRISVRAGVRRGRLPASLRALMFWTDDWHRTSEWYSWSLPV